MQKIIGNLAKKTKMSLLLLAVLFAVSASFIYGNYALASVSITPVSGGGNVSLDTSAMSTSGGSFTALSPLTITEATAG